MYKNKRSHRDANHFEIVKAVRSAGYAVIELDVVDVAIFGKKYAVIGEIKTEDGQYSLAQLEFLATHPGYAATFKTAEDALNAARLPEVYCFSDKQKQKILQIVQRYRGKTKAKYPRIDCSVFEREMAQ